MSSPDVSATWTIGIENNGYKSLYFFESQVRKGWISDTQANMLNFTGQHRCFIFNTSAEEIINLTGLIVVANTNKYMNMTGGLVTGKASITIDESLPVVEIASIDNDQRVFGVISSLESNDRADAYGIFVTAFDKELGDTRAYINALGEGAIWICNCNGTVKSGDYVTSCFVAGYGMRQDSGVMMNYTVAKTTMDCDFAPKTVSKKTIKTKVVSEQVTTNVQASKIETQTNIVYDDLTSRYVQKTTTSTIMVDVNDEVDLYDEDGTVIGKHTVPQTVTNTVNEIINDLDAMGNIQWIDALDDNGDVMMEPEYDTRLLDASGNIIDQATYDAAITQGTPVYIAAFVGCTYHCG